MKTTSRRGILPGLLLLVLILLLTVAVVGCGGTTTTTAGGGLVTTSSGPATTVTGGAQVDIKDLAFNPASVTVKVGETVTWTNSDSMTHTITGDNGEFDSGDIASGKTFSFTFQNPGTFAYHCSIHPSMKATIVVQ
jgi:plastocyanin